MVMVLLPPLLMMMMKRWLAPRRAPELGRRLTGVMRAWTDRHAERWQACTQPNCDTTVKR